MFYGKTVKSRYYFHLASCSRQQNTIHLLGCLIASTGFSRLESQNTYPTWSCVVG